MPEPYASDIFYYAQYDVVARHAAESSWKWSEIRPSYLVCASVCRKQSNLQLSLTPFLCHAD